jgi:hypothetical protein
MPSIFLLIIYGPEDKGRDKDMPRLRTYPYYVIKTLPRVN